MLLNIGLMIECNSLKNALIPEAILFKGHNRHRIDHIAAITLPKRSKAKPTTLLRKIKRVQITAQKPSDRFNKSSFILRVGYDLLIFPYLISHSAKINQIGKLQN